MIHFHNVQVLANWSAPVRLWFQAVLRQEFRPAPDMSREQWLSWLKNIQWHGIAPLLTHFLKQAPVGTHPPHEIMQQLRQNYFQEMAIYAYRITYIRQVLNQLQAAGIDPIVLKGAALTFTHYPAPGLRPYGDLDILIPHTDYHTTRTILLQNQFITLGDKRNKMAWNQEEEFLQKTSSAGFNFLVEVHWQIAPFVALMPYIPLTQIFARRHSLNIEQEFCLDTLSPADALIYGSQHLIYKHPNDLRLIWLYDIHCLARSISQSAWEDLVSESVAWHGRIALAEALQLAGQWFGTPYPTWITDLHHYPPPPKEQEIYLLTHRRKTWFTKLRQLQFQLAALSRRDRCAYLRNILFPDRQEISLWFYPELLTRPLPLAYLIRLIWWLSGKPPRQAVDGPPEI